MIRAEVMEARIRRFVQDQHPELLDEDQEERITKLLRHLGWSYIDHAIAQGEQND